MPALSLAISAMFILTLPMSGLILFQTSQLAHGGETGCISATVTLHAQSTACFSACCTFSESSGAAAGERFQLLHMMLEAKLGKAMYATACRSTRESCDGFVTESPERGQPA